MVRVLWQVFVPAAAAVVVVRHCGWTAILMPFGINKLCAHEQVRDLLNVEERDLIRAAYGVAPLKSDPGMRAWAPVPVPDTLCPCIIPESLRPPGDLWNPCREHEVGVLAS